MLLRRFLISRVAIFESSTVEMICGVIKIINSVFLMVVLSLLNSFPRYGISIKPGMPTSVCDLSVRVLALAGTETDRAVAGASRILRL